VKIQLQIHILFISTDLYYICINLRCTTIL